MALSGIQIYKLLPGTNCKDCGFPTCLAFAMKLATKQADLSACPHVSEESKAKLEAASQPPIRLVTLKADGREIKAGNETTMFRHEKRFFNRGGVFIRLYDDMPPADLRAQVEEIAAYSVEYVGMDLQVDGLAIEATGDATQFAAAVQTVAGMVQLPLVLVAEDANVMGAGLKALDGSLVPLIYAATEETWEAFAALAKEYGAPLAVRDPYLDGLADLTGKLKAAGVEDLVLDSGARDFPVALAKQTQLRRLALKKSVRALGYPLISFPCECMAEPELAAMAAAQAIVKYVGFVVLDEFDPATVYPLLTLRENIYTDPQTPIQVEPGIYEINHPTADDPLYITTNFSITYFAVANEIASSGRPGWLLVADSEGMSVLTAWAAGKFDAERIAKSVKTTGVADKLSHRKLVLPGHVSILLGEVEDELPGWKILVGPKDAVDIAGYVKVWDGL